ncbi:MAG: SAM-dependent chlorinase/fluorinase [Planctomycetes bacterium]|nr:SAM-dependent chlorinase/fluorinase [Planctomycetota bacterium]
MRPVITLLTDFGTKDSYVGIMKGIISGISPDANIIDLCHEIGHQDIFEGAYILYSSYKFFPRGTIHVVVVDPGVGTKRKIICAKTQNYLFLAPDNGILSLVLNDEKPDFIIEVTNKKYFLPEACPELVSGVSNTFHGRDIFAPVAAYLSKGVNPLNLGKKLTKIKEIELPAPTFFEKEADARTNKFVHATPAKRGVVKGEVIYIDAFGNLITNLKQDIFPPPLFPPPKRGRIKVAGEDVIVTAGKRKIRGISPSYADVPVGKPLAIFGSSGYLEISVNRGSAHDMLGLRRGNSVIVNYKI